MAIYHLSANIVRRSAGRTVTAAAAYRAGELIEDARTGLTFDYRRRPGVTHTEILAPPSAPAWMRDRAKLWNSVEAAEKRKDAQLAREITLALPHELTPAQRVALVKGFVSASFVSRGMVADIAIHAPSRHDADERNHHAHLLLTMRAITDARFGAKVTAWNDRKLLRQWRAQWAKHVNRALEQAGVSARVDHRSHAARGIGRVAQIHRGPAVVALAAKGMATDRGDLVREIGATNARLARIETHDMLTQNFGRAARGTLARSRDFTRPLLHAARLARAALCAPGRATTSIRPGATAPARSIHARATPASARDGPSPASGRADMAYREEAAKWDGLIDAAMTDLSQSPAQRAASVVALRIRQEAAATAMRRRVIEEEKQDSVVRREFTVYDHFRVGQ